jgi:hypothetical protein
MTVNDYGVHLREVHWNASGPFGASNNPMKAQALFGCVHDHWEQKRNWLRPADIQIKWIYYNEGSFTPNIHLVVPT